MMTANASSPSDVPTAVADPAAERVCVGVITGAHGLKGLVRVKPFTESPEGVAAYGPVQSEDGHRRFEIDVANRTGKGQVLVRIAGVTSREGADALKGERLYVDRDCLPPPEEDEFYHADLVGLAVVLEDGSPLGGVRAVHEFGAGVVVEIVDDSGALLTVPFTRAAVPEIDLAGGRLVVVQEQLLTPDADRPQRQDPEGQDNA